ncbi:MAG: hypothetical protein ABI543_14110 [Ignavibacteria bacterium]
MKNLLILFTLIFIISCGNDTVVNNNGGNPTADFDIYLYKQKEHPLKYSTYTIKLDGTGYKLFNDSLIVSSRSKQNRILLCKIDTNMMAISAIYYAETNGTNITKIPTGNYETDYFDLSPDAEKFLFTSGYNATLSIMNINGSGYVLLSDRIMNAAYIPKFSPSGDLIAYLETPQGLTTGLYITNISGTYKKLLKDSINISEGFNLDWSPDCKKIVFQSKVAAFDSRIYVVDTSGNNLTELTGGFEAAWSPSGNKICFARQVLNVHDIYTMNSNGTDITNITNTPSLYEGNPLWSSDGTKILYSSQDLYHPSYYSVYDMNTNSSRIIADSVNGAIWK